MSFENNLYTNLHIFRIERRKFAGGHCYKEVRELREQIEPPNSAHITTRIHTERLESSSHKHNLKQQQQRQSITTFLQYQHRTTQLSIEHR